MCQHTLLHFTPSQDSSRPVTRVGKDSLTSGSEGAHQGVKLTRTTSSQVCPSV